MPAAPSESRYIDRTSSGAVDLAASGPVRVVIDKRTDELCVAYDGPEPTDLTLKFAVDNGLAELVDSETGARGWVFVVQGTSLADPADLGREERAAALVAATRLAEQAEQVGIHARCIDAAQIWVARRALGARLQVVPRIVSVPSPISDVAAATTAEPKDASEDVATRDPAEPEAGADGSVGQSGATRALTLDATPSSELTLPAELAPSSTLGNAKQAPSGGSHAAAVPVERPDSTDRTGKPQSAHESAYVQDVQELKRLVAQLLYGASDWDRVPEAVRAAFPADGTLPPSRMLAIALAVSAPDRVPRRRILPQPAQASRARLYEHMASLARRRMFRDVALLTVIVAVGLALLWPRHTKNTPINDFNSIGTIP